MHRVYLQAHVGAGPLSSIMVAAHNKHGQVATASQAAAQDHPPWGQLSLLPTLTPREAKKTFENPSQPAIPPQLLKSIEWEIYRHGGPSTGSLT